jgi:hypothetical protein
MKSVFFSIALALLLFMADSLLLGYSRDRRSTTITGMMNMILFMDLNLDF